MSKRQFSDISSESNLYGALESVSRIVQHAEELLRAAQILKQDIQAGKHYGPRDMDHLRSITTEISSNLELLNEGPTYPQNKALKLETTASGSILSPAAVALAPWSPNDEPDFRPPLPTIHDPILERRIFTHAGLVKAQNPVDSYERLEWIGDAYLYLMSSAFIYQTFPNLPAGRCSQYRELLVRNKTLAEYTKYYQLDKQLRLPPEFLGSNSESFATNKQYKKVLGDVFEAYVAGIILGNPEQGLAQASSWVKTLWRNELKDELKKEFQKRPVAPADGALLIPDCQNSTSRANPGTDTGIAPSPGVDQSAPQTNPKVRLAQAIGGKGIRIDYKDEGEPKKEKKSGLPWYTVGVYLDGWGVKSFNLGYGSALSKKEAGAKAAQAALDNKKMINRFGQKKKEFDASMKAQQGYTDLKT